MILKKPYEPLTPGTNYKILQEGRDYYRINWRGKSLCVPKNVFEGRLDRKYEKVEEEHDYDWKE